MLVQTAARAQSSFAQQKDLVRADAAFSAAQKRVALVIGNKDYADAPLKNPVNDANAMAQELKDLGFEVILKTNLTKRQIREAVDEFAQKLGPNCIGLFYFSGHGVQVGGVNYLVPLNYHIERQADVEDEAYPASRLVASMGETGCGLNIIILDACRNNPLPKSIKALGDKGLVKMDAPKGTFIAYATAPGQTASDDSDKSNGLYTGVLLQKMKTPGLTIEQVFKATRISVDAASGGRQTPWEESSLQNDFYFAAGIPSAEPTVVPGNGSVVDTKAKLTVAVNAPDAMVTVDGQPAPGGVFVTNLLDEEKKKVQVKVTAPGYEGQLLAVTLLRGQPLSQVVTLEAVSAPQTPPTQAIGGIRGGSVTPRPIPSFTVPPSNGAHDPDSDLTDGVNKFNAGDFNGAVDSFSRAIKARPIFPEAYFNRGLAYNSLKQYDKAISDYTKYVGYKPKVADGYLERARNYAGAKQYPAALADYAKTLELKPTVFEVFYNRGDMYFGMGEFDKAVEDYTTYIQRMELKAEPAIYNNRGLAYYNKGNLASAEEDFKFYVSQKPDDLEAAKTLSEIKEKLKAASKLKPSSVSRLRGGQAGTVAETTSTVEPEVPESMRGMNFKYRVTVRVTISANGRHSETITSGSGNADADRAVLAAVARYRWRPAYVDGKPVDSSQSVVVNFENK